MPGNRSDLEKPIRSQVAAIMTAHTEARNNDSYLYLRLLMDTYNVAPETPLGEIDFETLPRFQTVRRRRQEIQNVEGRLIPTNTEVLLARGFYKLCPREILQEEGYEVEYLRGVCKKCPSFGKINCNATEPGAGLVG